MSRIVDVEPLDCLAWKDGEHGTTFDDGVLWVLEKIGELPTIERKTDEWCHDCKEYDQERHCCPRFNNIIRKTVQECREGYNIVYCKECEYYHDFGNFGKCDYFSNDEKHFEVLTNPYDWCSGAIRKNGEQDG